MLGVDSVISFPAIISGVVLLFSSGMENMLAMPLMTKGVNLLALQFTLRELAA